MDWFRVDSSAPQHHKMQRLRRSLGIPTEHAFGLCVTLWAWCAAGRETGSLAGLTDEDVDNIVHHDGFCQAARTSGLIDGEPGSSEVHEWGSRQPLVKRRDDDAKYRRGTKRIRDEHATSTQRTATGIYKTRQDTTRQEKSKGLREARATAPVKPSPGAVVIDLPCKGAWVYHVTEHEVAEWSRAYPALDIVAELRVALSWLRANPSKAKTPKGMPKFINAWLARARSSDAPTNGTKTNNHGRQAGGDQPRECHDARPDGPWAWLEPARDVLHAQTMLGMAEGAATRLGRLYGPVGWYYDCAWDAVKHWRAEVARLTPPEGA